MGLAIGSLSAQPAQAIRNARLLTFFLLFFIPILKQMSSSWFLPLLGLSLWLLIYSRRAPNRGVFIITSAAVTAGLTLVNIFEPLGLNVSKLHPTRLITDFYPDKFSLRPWDLPTWMVVDSLTDLVSVAGIYLALAAVFFWLARLRFSYSN